MNKPKIVDLPLSVVVRFRHGCAWEGCNASYQPPLRPKGWASVLMWKAQVVDWPTMATPMHRDCELCPVHALQFDAQLKRIR